MNRYNPDIHHRRSVRLKGFNYSQTGAYFVTICTRDRVCFLGQIVDGTMTLSATGLIVEEIWNSLPGRFRGVNIDAFVVMPNHIHGIVLVGAQFVAPEASRPDEPPKDAMNRAPTLGECVRTFKAASTRLIRVGGNEEFAWQRNYYEHLIRDDDELGRIREYIGANPGNWDSDENNILTS